VAPRLDPNDAKAVLGVLIGDALDQPRQYLSIGWMGLRFHDDWGLVRVLRVMKAISSINAGPSRLAVRSCAGRPITGLGRVGMPASFQITC